MKDFNSRYIEACNEPQTRRVWQGHEKPLMSIEEPCDRPRMFWATEEVNHARLAHLVYQLREEIGLKKHSAKGVIRLESKYNSRPVFVATPVNGNCYLVRYLEGLL